jgi:hypothetical protein
VHPRAWPIDGRCSCRRGTECEHPAKHPAIKGWIEKSTTDERTIRGWWMRWPRANVGIAAGRESRIVVLDVDPRGGGDESLCNLERDYGKLPVTAAVTTPGGGMHYWFRYPSADEVRSRDLAPGLELLSDGKGALAPPSVGINGRPYEPEDDQARTVELPAWLCSAAGSPSATDGEAVDTSVWLEMFKRGAVTEPGRNTAMARVVGHLLGRKVHVDLTAEIACLLGQHRFKPPMSRTEIDSVVESIVGREQRRRAARQGGAQPKDRR